MINLEKYASKNQRQYIANIDRAIKLKEAEKTSWQKFRDKYLKRILKF